MATAQQAARGAAWLIVTSLGARIVGVIGTLVITRFLDKEVVGEVVGATILVFTAGWLSTWGFGPYAVVKGRGDDALEVTWHATVAYFVLGAVGLGFVVAFAHDFAAFIDAPHCARYIPGMALAVFIKRLGAVPERVLTRSMRFRPVGLAAAFGEIVYAITAVSLAASGWGGDAIVVGNIVQSTVTVTILIYAAGWREWATPVRLRWERIKDMLRFGGPLAIESIAHNAARYWDNLIVTKLYGTGPAGAYNLAYNLADVPAVQIGEQLALVLLPSMAALPPERRPRALERSTALLSLIIFPLATGLGLVAPPLVALILSPEWQDVAPLLTILTVLSVFRPVTWVLSAYMEAQERTSRLMLLEVGKVIVLIGGMLALSPLGLHAAAGAIGIAYGLHAVAGVAMVMREGPSPRRLIIGFVQPLLACAVMFVVVLGVRILVERADLHVALQLAIEVVVGAITYVAAALVICRATARDFLNLLRDLLRRRRDPAASF
jgi:PST family polysaccharide transporter